MNGQKNHSEIFKIDGVGVNLSRFHPCTFEEKNTLRAELGYSEKDFIITVVAELNRNKNQIMLVRSVSELAKIIPSLKILLIGKETLPTVRDFVQKENLQKYVEFLGYRRDVEKLTMMSDVAFSASLRGRASCEHNRGDGVRLACCCERQPRASLAHKRQGDWLYFQPEVRKRNGRRDCSSI